MARPSSLVLVVLGVAALLALFALFLLLVIPVIVEPLGPSLGRMAAGALCLLVAGILIGLYWRDVR